jgi:hypothetical protein
MSVTLNRVERESKAFVIRDIVFKQMIATSSLVAGVAVCVLGSNPFLIILGLLLSATGLFGSYHTHQTYQSIDDISQSYHAILPELANSALKRVENALDFLPN